MTFFSKNKLRTIDKPQGICKEVGGGRVTQAQLLATVSASQEETQFAQGKHKKVITLVE